MNWFNELGFLGITEFIWLIPASLIVLLLARCISIRKKRTRILGATPPRSLWLTALIAALIMFTLIASLTRPYLGFQEFEVHASGEDVMVLVDVSTSMLTRDTSPSRIEFARRKVEDLITQIQARYRADRIGLVLFAGESYLFCPLTSDYAVLKTFAKSIHVGLITSGGSAINEALQTALNSFSQTKAQFPRLLLISDGEDDSLNVEEGIRLLRGAHIKMDILGVGTPEGLPIELRTGKFLKDDSGKIVLSRLNEASLQKLADQSGGKYHRAMVSDADIAALLHEEGGLPSLSSNSFSTTKYRSYNEIGPFLIWIPIAIILLCLLLKRRELVFFGIAFLAFSSTADVAQAEGAATKHLSLHDAYKAYENGDFNAAEDGFNQSLTSTPHDLKIKQALASTYYKLRKYKEAQKLFSEIIDEAKNGRQKFESYYNRGNSNFMDKNFEAAIKDYENALRIKKDDEKAAHNLELAKHMLEEQKKQEQQKEDSKQEKDNSKDQQKESEQQKENEKNDSSTEQKEKQSGNADNQQQGSESGDNNDQSSNDIKQESDSNKNEAKEEEQKEAEPNSDADKKEKESSSEEQTAPPPTYRAEDIKSLSEREAQAWLESLNDSPVLLRRKVGKRKLKQTW